MGVPICHRDVIYYNMASTVWNKVPDYIRNAPLVMLFKKQLNTYYFGHLSRPDG